MSKRYKMKDLGELHFILGLQVKRDRKRIRFISARSNTSIQCSNDLVCLTAS